jgi:hypothetical protein
LWIQLRIGVSPGDAVERIEAPRALGAAADHAADIEKILVHHIDEIDQRAGQPDHIDVVTGVVVRARHAHRAQFDMAAVAETVRQDATADAMAAFQHAHAVSAPLQFVARGKAGHSGAQHQHLSARPPIGGIQRAQRIGHCHVRRAGKRWIGVVHGAFIFSNRGSDSVGPCHG